jgi:hypothetical protein
VIANEERIALILEANDKATAHLQRIRKEIEATRGSAAASGQQQAKDSAQVEFNSRRSAMAMSSIAFAAQNATMGTRGVVIATGQLVETAAQSSRHLATWAPHIAAATIIAGTLLTLFQRMRQETGRISESQKRLLGNFEDSQIEAVYQRARQRKEDAAAAFRDAPSILMLPGEEQTNAVRTRDRLEAELNNAIAWEEEAFRRLTDVRRDAGRRTRDEAAEEAKRTAKEARDQARQDEKARGQMLFDLRNQAAVAWSQANGNELRAEQLRIEQAHQARLRQIAELKTLTEQQRDELRVDASAVRDADIEAGRRRRRMASEEVDRRVRSEGDDIRDAFAARMEMIEAERQARLQAGIDVAVADREAEHKKNQLRREALRATVMHLKQIEDATIHSRHSQIRAIGVLAQTLRRLQIGAEASMAAVESARAFGKVPAYLAAHDYRGAALSAMAGVKLAAAAALGFREAGGGGSGGSGGGGSGPGATGVERFEPRGAAGSGGIHLTIITRDGSGRERIQQTLHDLHRGQVLKLPAMDLRTEGT